MWKNRWERVRFQFWKSHPFNVKPSGCRQVLHSFEFPEAQNEENPSRPRFSPKTVAESKQQKEGGWNPLLQQDHPIISLQNQKRRWSTNHQVLCAVPPHLRRRNSMSWFDSWMRTGLLCVLGDHWAQQRPYKEQKKAWKVTILKRKWSSKHHFSGVNLLLNFRGGFQWNTPMLRCRCHFFLGGPLPLLKMWGNLESIAPSPSTTLEKNEIRERGLRHLSAALQEGAAGAKVKKDREECGWVGSVILDGNHEFSILW